MSRTDDISRFYDLLSTLARTTGGPVSLADVKMSPLPSRGVYFFFEPGEVRTDSGSGLRVVRVGTHALKPGATSTLRGRLRQHGGTKAGRGNHRGSIFRLLTGDALMRCGLAPFCTSWGGTPSVREAEAALESAVSRRLALTSVTWISIDDDPGPHSQRGRIERNAIALLSNLGKAPLDPPSASWLGHNSSRPRVRASGLWNQNHVDEAYDPAFLQDFKRLLAHQ